MDANKFCFVICSNEPYYLQECLLYIGLLEVPEGYSTQVLSVEDAVSMAAGYNEGMEASDAKYKIYLHQDVFILYRRFLYAVLDIFQSDETIGMIGMVGSTKMPRCGIMWYSEREGALYNCNVPMMDYEQYDYRLSDGLHEVEAVDGLLIATSQDIPWREDLFDGWDFYDVSQSYEFRRKGLRVVVPEQNNAWCFHDDGILNLFDYDHYRHIFLKEYAGDSDQHSEDDRKNYVIVVGQETENIVKQIAEQLKSGLESAGENVYFVTIDDTDSFEECRESFYDFHADCLITFNCAGFHLTDKDGDLLYNYLYCRCFHILTKAPWQYGTDLMKRMNIMTSVVGFDERDKQCMEYYYQNIPCAVSLPGAVPEEKGTKEEIRGRIQRMPEVFRKMADELIGLGQKHPELYYTDLLELYLKSKNIPCDNNEFADLLVRLKEVPEYLALETGDTPADRSAQPSEGIIAEIMDLIRAGYEC